MLKQRLARLEAMRRRSMRPAGVGPPVHRRLQSAQDLVDLIEEEVNNVRGAPWVAVLAKAQVIGRLVGVARAVLETNQIAARMSMLEAVLKRRKEEPS